MGHVHQEDFDRLPAEPPTSIWLELIDHLRIKAFAETTVAPSCREGVRHLVRISGVGAIKPNTAVLGFHEPKKFRHDYFKDPSSGFASAFMDTIFPIKQSDNPNHTGNYLFITGNYIMSIDILLMNVMMQLFQVMIPIMKAMSYLSSSTL